MMLGYYWASEQIFDTDQFEGQTVIYPTKSGFYWVSS